MVLITENKQMILRHTRLIVIQFLEKGILVSEGRVQQSKVWIVDGVPKVDPDGEVVHRLSSSFFVLSLVVRLWFIMRRTMGRMKNAQLRARAMHEKKTKDDSTSVESPPRIELGPNLELPISIRTGEGHRA